MKNVLIAFVVGLVGGTVAVQAAGRLVWLMRSAPDSAQAMARGQTPDEMDEEQFRKAEGPITWLSLVGGVVCATVCAVRAKRAPAAAGPGPRRPGTDEALTDTEFDRAYQCCSWVKLAANGADFVQGFLVGALARPDPALAAKIDGLGPDAMAGLRRRLIDCQERLG